MIAASTLLIKQHFLSDVLLGALLGWASFALAFKASHGEKWDAHSASVRAEGTQNGLIV